MGEVQFAPLVEPTPEIAAAFSRWENDPALIPLARPNRSAEDLARREIVTVDELARRLRAQHIFLISLDGQLVGEMSYHVDPEHLFRRVAGTAWIGITIGEERARGQGVGRRALGYLEQQVALRGLRRIELGVFEFNTRALALYQKLGYQEIGRIDDFTYWEGRLWRDVRMEKDVSG